MPSTLEALGTFPVSGCWRTARAAAAAAAADVMRGV